MKLDLGKLISIGSLVAGLVNKTQSALKGAKGSEKHDAVADAVKDLLPIVEGAAGKDIASDAAFIDAVNTLIVAEKAVFKARAALDILIADIKAKRAA